MPKIYIKSKDVAGASVVEYDGVCYTRTGNTFKARSVTLTPSPSVIQYFTDCDDCARGQAILTTGGTASIPNTAANFQFKFDGSVEGDTTTLDLSGATTCSVLLSVNGDNNLVFDAATPATGNGPHVFTTVPQTISYVDCQTHTYDITLAALGSYVVTLNRTGTGGTLPANVQADTVNIYTTYGTDLSALSASEQAELITVVNTTIYNSALSGDINTISTTLSPYGNADNTLRSHTTVKYHANTFVTGSSALETSLTDGSLRTAVISAIESGTTNISSGTQTALVSGMVMEWQVSASSAAPAPAQPTPTPTPTSPPSNAPVVTPTPTPTSPPSNAPVVTPTPTPTLP